MDSHFDENSEKRSHSTGRRSDVSPGSSSQTISVECVEVVEKWPSNFRAYLALLGGFLLMFNSWGLVNAFGTFQSYYKRHLLPDTDIKLITLIGSTQSFMVLIFSFGVGRLLDAGYHRLLSAVGSVLTSLAMFMLSLAGGDGKYGDGKFIYIWLAQGLAMGLGMSCVFVYSSQVVASWFRMRRSLAIGISASGASIAGLVYPMLFKRLVPRYGFATSVRFVALLVTLTSILAFLVATPEPSRGRRTPERWSDVSIWWDKSAFKMVAYRWFCASIAFMFLGFYAVFFNMEDWARWRGVGEPEDIIGGQGVQSGGFSTFLFLAIMNATSTIGRLGSAWLSDHFGALNVHVLSALACSLCVLCWWTVTKILPVAIVFVVVYGMLSGALIALPPACVASLLPEEQQNELGHWTGMMYTISAPFSLVGPVIGATIADKFGYIPLMGWCGSCLFVSFLCMAAARYTAVPERTLLSKQPR